MNFHGAANTGGQWFPYFKQTWQFANCKYLQPSVWATHRKVLLLKRVFMLFSWQSGM